MFGKDIAMFLIAVSTRRMNLVEWAAEMSTELAQEMQNQFSVLSSQFSVLSSQFSVLSSQFSVGGELCVGLPAV